MDLVLSYEDLLQLEPGQALQLTPQGLEPIQNRLHDAGTDNSVLSWASTA